MYMVIKVYYLTDVSLVYSSLFYQANSEIYLFRKLLLKYR